MGICKGTLKTVAGSQMSNGYSKAFLKSMFSLTQAPESGFNIGVRSAEFDHLAPQYTKGASVSGVQKKLLMSLEGGVLNPVSTGGQYIVKPAPSGLDYLPANEHAMMNLARSVGFNVAYCALIPFVDGELGYITKRFDILPTGKRYFMEDGASICNVHPKNKGSDALSYERALMDMYIAAGRKMTVLLNGFRQVLFAYLIGNNDLHLKNFAMYREPGTHSTTMVDYTPLYDVLSVFPYPAYQGDYLTLSLLQSEVEGVFSPEYEIYGYYTQHDFIQLATNLGFPRKGAVHFVRKLTSDVEKTYQHYISESFMPQEMKQLLESEIKGRIDCMRRAPLSEV